MSTSAAASPGKPAVSPACACGRLRRATRALTQHYDNAMAPSGLRVTQFSLLRTLLQEGASPVTRLADVLLLDRTALSRNLDPLLARGLVTVTAGRDARTRTVALTAGGRRAVRLAAPHWQQAQREVARKLGPERLQSLIATLGELESLHPATRS
ncbi:MAG: MarR family winged helix-turn-helix transcriptional regulator [Casimicrobiaceae bacterium]